MDQIETLEENQQFVSDQTLQQQPPLEDPNELYKEFGESQVDVSVPEVILKDDNFGKYCVYLIRGKDRTGEFEVQRRYNDFWMFRQVLLGRWPGCFVPPIPPKQAMGNMDQKFINQRKRLLELFLKQLSTSNLLWYSEEAQAFHHNNPNDIDRYFAQLPRLTTEELIKRYETNFKHLKQLEINLPLVNSILNFQAFLRRITPMMNNFKDIYRNLIKARDAHNDQYLTFIQYLLPEYEKTCLFEAVFSDNSSEELKALQEKQKAFLTQNDLEKLMDACRMESREIEAFLEAIGQRDNYETQKQQAQQKLKQLQIEMQEIIAGKTTLKSIFTNTTKEEQIARLQIKIDIVLIRNKQKQNKEIEQLQFLCDILTVVLGYEEIPRFRKEKEAVYFVLIKQVGEVELEYAKLQQQFWEFILSNPNIQKQ